MMMTRAQVVAAVAILVAALAVSARAQGPWDAPGRCGPNAPTPVCSGCRCCSRWDYCGNTALHCGSGCQSQCGCGSGNGTSVASIVTPAVFEELLPYRNDLSCPARGFYTYDAFIAAAADNSEAGFGTTGDVDTRKREIAAFLAEPAHRTSGGWDGAPGGAYAWGLCFKPAGVNATDPVIFFETAIEAWMTAQPPTKPSCHDVVTGEWSPSDADVAAGRLPGFGVIANIINGPAECGHGFNQGGNDRIGFYKRFCDILGVSYGDNLDCYNQKPFDTTTGVAAALDETTTAAPRHADA